MITNTRLYGLVRNKSSQDNKKLLKLLNSKFKKTIKWSKYLIKDQVLTPNQNLNYLVNPSFLEVSKLLVVLFENEVGKVGHAGCYP